MADEETSIEEAALARREKLRALKAAKELFDTPDEDSLRKDSQAEETDDKGEDEAPNVKFRNYLPNDKQLQEAKLAPPVVSKFEDPVATDPLPAEKIEDPFFNIAPKKPNWDLRKDVQKKLDKLERRTQKAIYKLAQQEQQDTYTESRD